MPERGSRGKRDFFLKISIGFYLACFRQKGRGSEITQLLGVISFHKVAKVYPLLEFTRESMWLKRLGAMIGLKRKMQTGWRGFESLQPSPGFKTRTVFYSFIKAERAWNSFCADSGVSTWP